MLKRGALLLFFSTRLTRNIVLSERRQRLTSQALAAAPRRLTDARQMHRWHAMLHKALTRHRVWRARIHEVARRRRDTIHMAPIVAPRPSGVAAFRDL